MKVQFPLGTTSFGYGAREFPIDAQSGECDLPDEEPELIVAARATAQSIGFEHEGLLALESRTRAASPQGQGQEFARAMMREILIGRAEPAPTASAPAPGPGGPAYRGKEAGGGGTGGGGGERDKDKQKGA